MPSIRAALVHGQAHVPLVAAGFVWGTTRVLGGPVPRAAWAAALAGSAAVYLGERALGVAPEDARNHPARTAWLGAHRPGVAGALAALGAGTAAALARLPCRAQGVAAGLAAVAGAYGAAWTAGAAGRLKGRPRLRLAAVGGAWAAGTVALPRVAAGRPLGRAGWALAGARAALVGANVVLLDWPDRHGDAAAGLATFATPGDGRRLRRAVGALLAGHGVLDRAARAAAAAPRRPRVAEGALALLALAAFRPPAGTTAERLALDALVGVAGAG